MFSLAQYNAAHTSAVMFDRLSQGTIALTGADRASFLHGLVTNDIARLTKGMGAYAAYLTPQGRMISDMLVIETGTRLSAGRRARTGRRARRAPGQADLFRGRAGERRQR